MPRSAFLEGAREAEATKTCSAPMAKQKTAVPQGAASLSLAVLEMLPTQLLSVLHKPRCVCVRRTPPSAKNAKDGAPHRVGDASEIKSLGHPPRTASNARERAV